MSKYFKKCLSVLTVAFILIGATLPAYAITDSVRVGLSIRQTFMNHTKMDVDDTFSYVLTPLETGNPLPAQSEKIYSFTMKGTKELRLADIAFTKPNIYRYELKQSVVSEKKGYKYDGEVYTVEVYVTTSEEGKLSANTVVYKKNRQKAEEISFENGYQESSNPSIPIQPPKTSDHTNLTLYYMLLAFSILGFVLVLVMRKKEKNQG